MSENELDSLMRRADRARKEAKSGDGGQFWCETCATANHEYVKDGGLFWNVTVATTSGAIYEVEVLLTAGATFRDAIEEALEVAGDDPETRLVTLVAKRGEE